MRYLTSQFGQNDYAQPNQPTSQPTYILSDSCKQTPEPSISALLSSSQNLHDVPIFLILVHKYQLAHFFSAFALTLFSK